MTTIAFILLFVGTLIFLFSFVFKIKKNDFEKDYRLALQDFEKKKDLQENVDNSIENVDNIISEQEYINDVFETSDDDEDFKNLMGQSKFFIRLVGVFIFIIGIVVYFIYTK